MNLTCRLSEKPRLCAARTRHICSAYRISAFTRALVGSKGESHTYCVVIWSPVARADDVENEAMVRRCGHTLATSASTNTPVAAAFHPRAGHAIAASDRKKASAQSLFVHVNTLRRMGRQRRSRSRGLTLMAAHIAPFVCSMS
jgi:hypothetical protein